MNRYNSTERKGINATESAVISDLGWIFREQPICDMGIDAHIESVCDDEPSGRLIGVQVKTGESHFTEHNDSFVYYGKIVHLEYWLDHSLPVIIVAHFPNSNQTLWAHVSEDTIVRTNKSWKISIPKDQVLDETSKEKLLSLFEGTKKEIKLRNLFLHSGVIRFLHGGGKLVVTYMDWHHKSLKRGPVELIKIDGENEESIEFNHPWYTGYGVKEVLELLYPWASVVVDKEYYEENFSDSFYDVYTDLYIENHEIYPYATRAGEVSDYRLELKLNLLGNSFLVVLGYVDN